MHGDAHHRRLRLDPVIEALPGLPDVITAKIPPSLLLKAGLSAAYGTFGSWGETRKIAAI